MCGHAGIIGPGICDIDLKILRELSQCTVVRGQDGAGILQGAVFQKSSHYTVEKTGNEISWLLWYHKNQKGGDKTLFDNIHDNFYCVHTRAATRGIISKSNAHPFEFENLVGMHNGTLKDAKYDPKNTGKTDSELMFADMNERGVHAVLREINPLSAYAIVVFHKKEKKFYFARNDDRSLYVTWNKNRRVLYYASEYGLLEWILGRNGIKYDTICFFKAGLIYTFDPHDVNTGRRPDWIAFEAKDYKKEKKIESPKVFTPPPPLKQDNKVVKDFREFNIQAQIPHQQKPKLTVINSDVRPEVAKPSPLPEQQKAKEKDQERAAVGTESPTKGGEGKHRQVFPRARLHVNCTGCGKDMDLLDRYRGNELKTGLWLCDKCDEGMTELKKMKFLQ